MKTLSIFVCGLLGFGCGADASAASYDCSKASTIIEKTICNDAELSSLDEMMAARYRPWLQGQSDKEKARSEQRKWLKFRDQCVTYQSPTRQSCLKSAYEERISFLASTPVESGDVHVPTLASPESANLESASKVKPAASAIDKNALAKVIAKCDGYTALKSICWAQTAEERESVLASRGYTCDNKPNNYINLVCKSGSMEIELSDDAIDFNCENFNTCRYELKEVAQMLVDQGIVPKLEFKTYTLGDGVVKFRVAEYCGRGRQAEELCVMSINVLGVQKFSVIIRRGASGEAAPNFD